MDRELARKRPANTTAWVEYPRTITLTRPFHQRAELMKDIRRMAKRGEIGHMYELREAARGWEVRCVQLKPRDSWWRRYGLKLAVASTLLAGSLAALVWAVATLVAAVAAALPVIGGFVLVIIIALALCAVSSGGRVIEVVQKVRIRG